MSGHRESQPDIHAAGIAFHWRVDEIRDFREIDVGFELSRHLRPAHAEDRAIEKYVLAPGQFLMKPRSDFEQGSEAARNVRSPFGRRGNPRQHL